MSDLQKSKIENEKHTIRMMVDLYCRHHLKTKVPSEEYKHLADYACRRLDHCHFGEQKKACKNCPIHCYAPKERELIRQVMRWTGPRMIFYSPLEAIKHILGKD